MGCRVSLDSLVEAGLLPLPEVELQGPGIQAHDRIQNIVII